MIENDDPYLTYIELNKMHQEVAEFIRSLDEEFSEEFSEAEKKLFKKIAKERKRALDLMFKTLKELEENK